MPLLSAIHALAYPSTLPHPMHEIPNELIAQTKSWRWVLLEAEKRGPLLGCTVHGRF